MRSTRSPGSSARQDDEAERGAAVVEFSLIGVMLSAIFFVVLQVGIYLYQRSVVASSALAAARYAANANVDSAAGAGRASELIAAALSDRTASGISCTSQEQIGAGGVALVEVTCRGAVPSIVTVLGSVLPIDASASAIEEGQS